MKILLDIVDYFFYIISANVITLSYLKYVFAQGYQFPYFGLMIMTVPIGIWGLLIIVGRVLQYKGNGPMFYLSFTQYLVIAIAYSASYILSVSSLYYSNMKLVRFFVTSYCSDLILQPMLGCIILKRDFSGHYLLACLFAIAGYIFEDFIQFFRNANNEIETTTAEGWESPLLCLISRICFIMGSVLSKQFILIRSSYLQLKDQEKFAQKFFTVPGEKTLLQKDSFIAKRFECLKKMDASYENLSLERDDLSPQFQRKIQAFQRLLDTTMIRVHEIGSVPQKRKTPDFNFFIDYGALNQDELDEIMQMDGQYMSSLIQAQKNVRLEDLRKWELEAILEKEKSEKGKLEELLFDFIDVKYHAHLFNHLDDLVLTQLDDLYDSFIYDNELFIADNRSTLELYGIIGFALMCLSYLAAGLNQEFYNSIWISAEYTATTVPQYYIQMNYYYALFIVCSLFFLIKPLVIMRIAKNHDQSVFFSVKIIIDFFVLVIFSTFTEKYPNLSTNHFIALGCIGFGLYLVYAGENHKKKWAEFSSIVELVKTYFSRALEWDQILLLEIRLIQIHQFLGRTQFLRVVIDLIASGNPRSLLHSANPVNKMRKNFDPAYARRVRCWGGSYPRPLVQPEEATWVSHNKEDIWINEIEKVLEKSKENQFRIAQQYKMKYNPYENHNYKNQYLINGAEIQK